MAFEKVDTNSLKNALNACKNAINYSISEELITSISNPTVWQSESQPILKEALVKLTGTRYTELEKKLNDYLECIGYINEYQKLQKENESLQNKYDILQPNLYYQESIPVTTYSYSGTATLSLKTRTVKNYDIERQMLNIQSTINNNKSRMNSLESKVSSLI